MQLELIFECRTMFYKYFTSTCKSDETLRKYQTNAETTKVKFECLINRELQRFSESLVNIMHSDVNLAIML